MLQTVESVHAAAVIATDGEIGRIRDFLFDDSSWMIRYAVVDVRRWLNRHDVLIATSAFDHPDWTRREFRANLTKDQVRHSPDVDAHKPVSRQQEVAMREYYKWPAYWREDTWAFVPIPVTEGREFPAGGADDPHLRSVEALIGYRMYGHDGELGRVKDFLVDQDSWHIGYLEVQAGDWLLSRAVLFPTPWVENISWARRTVELKSPRRIHPPAKTGILL